MRSGRVVRHRERVDVVARRGELDQRHAWRCSSSRLPSCQPHLTRELPASMARIMRPSPTRRGRCGRRACRRASRRRSAPSARRPLATPVSDAPVGEAHAQLLPGVRVEALPLGAHRVEARAPRTPPAIRAARCAMAPARASASGTAMNCSSAATGRRRRVCELARAAQVDADADHRLDRACRATCVSTRMPPSFAPSTTMSFGHFRRGARDAERVQGARHRPRRRPAAARRARAADGAARRRART